MALIYIHDPEVNPVYKQMPELDHFTVMPLQSRKPKSRSGKQSYKALSHE